jgi:hypothetical protein
MKAITFLFLLVLLLSACKPEAEDDNDKKDKSNPVNENKQNEISKTNLNINNIYNQLGLFIAGKEASQFKNIQNKEFYINYKQKLNETWNQSTLKNLSSIEKWEGENNFSLSDTLTLFYPFSGPDFLYADAFFPNAGTQIMVGLENPGKLPNLVKMNDSQISIYLYKLYHSLRYINQNGYFTTSQMQSDFKDSSMNGIIHILMFYIAKTGHQIDKINYIQIDNFGNEKEKKNFELESNKVNGIKIYFYSDKLQKFKTLYYFPFDLSNENIKDNLGFITFLSRFELKNTFLKSASYLLHNNDFSIIRDLILKQSDKILQDDSGIPYELLLSSGYNVQLFGQYTFTTKTFEKFYQPNLSKALAEAKSKELPFKLGYNSLKNEMVLMLAHPDGGEINKPITYKTEKKGVVFKIQIKSTWKKIPLNASVFKGLPKVDFYYTDNLYKYTIGSFSSAEACEEYRKIAANKGFNDAFIVAFYQKNRISLDDAEKILKGE